MYRIVITTETKAQANHIMEELEWMRDTLLPVPFSMHMEEVAEEEATTDE